jgi:Berberine and berberine like
MVSQDVDQATAMAVWKDFFDGIAGSPGDFTLLSKPSIVDFPARHVWDPEFLKRVPGAAKHDDRPGADPGNLFWSGDEGQSGQVLHGYDSLWLPAALLDEANLPRFADALIAACGHWQVSLHVNKGLAGAPPEAIEAARNTATNPAVLDAFALAIIGAEEPPAYPGIAGHAPNVAEARSDAAGIARAMAELRKMVPEFASYVAESNYFEQQWQRAFWGGHYGRLFAVKTKYDSDGLFFGHHGVGSEAWSADGFSRLG